jgi:cysteinyl-tRNA synthetase
MKAEEVIGRALMEARDRPEVDEPRQIVDALSAAGFIIIPPAQKMNGAPPQWIAEEIAARQRAKERFDWRTADRIRDNLRSRGVWLSDKRDGKTEWGYI